MTRLLFPEAYGLVAAASAPIVGLTLISDFGIHALIVQSPRGDQDDFLTFSLGISVLAWNRDLAGTCTILRAHLHPFNSWAIPDRQRLRRPIIPAGYSCDGT